MTRRRRPSKGKRINPTFFVFCEGETEEAYVNHLKSEYRLPSVHIDAQIGRNNITESYIQNYKANKPTHEKDQDFLLYDLDAPAILQRLERIKHAVLLVSNPCIELWFLLHYKNQTAVIDENYCCNELRNRNRIYNKGEIDKRLKEKLREKRSDAIKRAKKLQPYVNPSTTVYRFIAILDELKSD